MDAVARGDATAPPATGFTPARDAGIRAARPCEVVPDEPGLDLARRRESVKFPG